MKIPNSIMPIENQRYSRNEIYIPQTTQNKIKSTRILLAGAGLGSVIAECLLRTGFENITLADGDRVELSNLNRQNYTEDDISKYKTEAIARRLRAVNSSAKITTAELFLDTENIPGFVQQADIIINAIDFESEAHIFLDRIATSLGKTVVLPLNLGFGALAAVFNAASPDLSSLIKDRSQTYPAAIVGALAAKPVWLNEALAQYLSKREVQGYDPQLAIGSSLAAGLVTSLLVGILSGDSIRYFPEWYFLDTRKPHAG
jgi:molybdopterin/thiamine biosynthesis adenylyltransferase